MRSTAKCYDELREYIGELPLIDCHDHTWECGLKFEDAGQLLFCGYLESDVISASFGADVLGEVRDASRPIEERWPAIEALWGRTGHTGYAQVTRRVLREFHGIERLGLDALKELSANLPDYSDPETYEAVLEKAGIESRVLNPVTKPAGPSLADYEARNIPPRAFVAIPLLQFHGIRSKADVQGNLDVLGGAQAISLDDYLDGCRAVFERYKTAGAVAFKDQCAYLRPINFGNPTRAEAEAVFNWFMEDPRRSAGYPDQVKPLDDWLFNQFMRMARDMELPVQLHTGHMAGIYNDLAKTNAIQLVPLLELHQDVRFDLFHSNWPYMGELLYLCKNFPNVSIDFCWTHIIDPLYSQNMMKQALTSVPHAKIHGFGADGFTVDRAWAHAEIARDNTAAALANMVEMEYLDLDGAKEVARQWLYDGPKNYFGLPG